MPANSEVYLYSNEGEVYQFFPPVKSLTGVIVGVGSDQTLDLFASNENFNAAILADKSDQNCAQTTLMLETGSQLLTQNGGVLTPEDFINSFRRDRFKVLEPEIEKRLDRRTVNRGGSLVEGWLPYSLGNGNSKSLSYVDFMHMRSALTDVANRPYAWYATSDNLNRVLQAYNDGLISVITADFLDKQDVYDLGAEVEDLGSDISCLYLSNVEQNLYNEFEDEDVNETLWHNLHLLPLSDRGLILRTAMDGIPLNFRIQSPQVRDHEVLRQLYLRWHYNTETFAHQRKALSRDPQYANMGWITGALELDGSHAKLPKNIPISNLV